MITISMGVILLFVLENVRRSRREALLKKYTYSLFALRDELRELAMKKQVSEKNWIFKYLDSSITRSIFVLKKLTPVYFFAIVRLERQNKRLLELQERLEEELNKAENSPLKEIRDKFADTLGNYLRDRHWMIGLVFGVGSALGSMIEKLLDWWRDTLRLATGTPETSTLPSFDV